MEELHRAELQSDSTHTETAGINSQHLHSVPQALHFPSSIASIYTLQVGNTDPLHCSLMHRQASRSVAQWYTARQGSAVMTKTRMRVTCLMLLLMFFFVRCSSRRELKRRVFLDHSAMSVWNNHPKDPPSPFYELALVSRPVHLGPNSSQCCTGCKFKAFRESRKNMIQYVEMEKWVPHPGSSGLSVSVLFLLFRPEKHAGFQKRTAIYQHAHRSIFH